MMVGKLFGEITIKTLNWKKKIQARKWFAENIELTKGKTRGMFDENKAPHTKLILELIGLRGLNVISLKVASQTQKGHPLDTKIPTLNGFKTVEELESGDILFDENGKKCRLISKSEIFTKNLYRVWFDDGSFVDCSDDHLWTVNERKKRGRKKHTYTTLELIKKNIKMSNGASRFSIPLTKPVSFSSKTFDIDPYVLGLWLGDGSKNSNVITIDKLDLELLDYINNTKHTAKVGIFDKNSRAVSIRIDGKETKDRSFISDLKKNNLYENKHIPEKYFWGSINQRISLLQGLLDSDGSVRRCGSITISQSNKTVIMDISRLLKTLGIKHSVKPKERIPKLNGVDMSTTYTLEFTIYKEQFNAFRLKRKLAVQNTLTNPKNRAYQVIHRYIHKIESIPTVKSQCLMVDSQSHLYLCTDNFIPTHNTTLSLGTLMYWLDTDYHDMFYMIPRANDLKKFLEYKIKPAIDGCKTVKEKMLDYNQEEKDRKNSFFYKTRTSMLAILSANDTKSITTKYGVFDEVAEMPVQVVDEALERFKDYGDDYKVLMVSTQMTESDAINHYFENSEIKLRYELRCIHCNELFYPMPNDLKIMSEDEYLAEIGKKELSKGEISSKYTPYASSKAYLQCPHCEAKITNKDKTEAIMNGLCDWVMYEIDSVDEYDTPTYKTIKTIKTAKDLPPNITTIGLEANSMINPRVHIKHFARKELNNRYASFVNQKENNHKYMVGWWNILPKEENKEEIKPSEVLKICNNYAFGVVPDNISHLHIGVDLQKDRLYYTVGAVEYSEEDKYGIKLHIIEYGELYSNFSNQDFIDLEEILDKKYHDKDGNMFTVTSGGCDIRGFDQNDPSSRSSQMLDFIFNYSLKLKSFGLANWDNFLYPMWGVDRYSRQELQTQGFKREKLTREIDGEKITINALSFSNLKIKTLQHSMIERAILKSNTTDKDELKKLKTNLLHITKEALIRWQDRQSLPVNQRGDKHAIESHLTSEVLGYAVKNGKKATIKTYVKKHPSVRNDYLDCNDMIVAQILAHGTYKEVKKELVEYDARELKALLS